MIHYARGERAEAAPSFKRALAADPNDINALIWLISLYVRAGKTLPARPLAQHLLEILGEHPNPAIRDHVKSGHRPSSRPGR